MLKAALTDADKFVIKFPSESTLEDKILFTMAGVFMDFMYFDDSPADHSNDNNNHNHNGTSRSGNVVAQVVHDIGEFVSEKFDNLLHDNSF